MCGWGKPMAVRLATHSSIMALGPHTNASIEVKEVGNVSDEEEEGVVVADDSAFVAPSSPASSLIADRSCDAPIRPLSRPERAHHE
jgi:hypothetical protein